MFISEVPFEELNGLEIIETYIFDMLPILFECKKHWIKEGVPTLTYYIVYLQSMNLKGETYVIAEVERKYIDCCKDKELTVFELFKKANGTIKVVGFPYTTPNDGIYCDEIQVNRLSSSDVPDEKVYLNKPYVY